MASPYVRALMPRLAPRRDREARARPWIPPHARRGAGVGRPSHEPHPGPARAHFVGDDEPLPRTHRARAVDRGHAGADVGPVSATAVREAGPPKSARRRRTQARRGLRGTAARDTSRRPSCSPGPALHRRVRRNAPVEVLRHRLLDLVAVALGASAGASKKRKEFRAPVPARTTAPATAFARSSCPPGGVVNGVAPATPRAPFERLRPREVVLQPALRDDDAAPDRARGRDAIPGHTAWAPAACRAPAPVPGPPPGKSDASQLFESAWAHSVDQPSSPRLVRDRRQHLASALRSPEAG